MRSQEEIKAMYLETQAEIEAIKISGEDLNPVTDTLKITRLAELIGRLEILVWLAR